MSHLIQASGHKEGSAAALLSDLAVGGWFDVGGQSYQKVTVTGQSPGAGKVFAHRLSDGVVVQLDGAQRAEREYVGTFAFASTVQEALAEDNPTAAGTVGECPAGGFLDTADPDGRFARVVTVQDADGVPIAPSAGSKWVAAFKTAVVAEALDATAIEAWGSVSAYRVQ